MRKTIYILLTCMVTVLVSCADEFIDLDPLASITESDYFNKAEHFEASANGLYTGLVGWSSAADFMDHGTDLTSYIEGTQQDYGRGQESLGYCEKSSGCLPSYLQSTWLASHRCH